MSPSINKVDSTTPISKITKLANAKGNLFRHLKKNTTAVIAAASVTLGSVGGATIKDNVTAYGLNTQVEDLQKGLVDSGANQQIVDQLAFKIERDVDRNTSWYESRTSKAIKRAMAWQTNLDSLATEEMVKFAYKKGVQDTFDYFENQSALKNNSNPNIREMKSFGSKVKNILINTIKRTKI